MTIVDVDCTPVFWANKKAYDSGLYRVIANQGSTRSSKTYSLSQLMVDIATKVKKEISIVSPSLPHLKKGARKDVLKILQDLQIFNEDDFNRTDQVYNFPLTGSTIEFFGVEDSGKVRGPGRQILYVNEANLISYETYIQLALRTSESIFIDFNPADEYSWVYDVADKKGNKLIISTYLNNKANLSKEQVEEIEGLKDADENLWKVFGLGQRGTSSASVYTHWKICDSLPNKSDQWYGQDFGYNVQSALVKIEFFEGALYWHEELYDTKLTTADLIEKYKQLNIGRLEIFCDAAEPKTIEEITRARYNAKPADKKSVIEGIRMIKSLPLYITRSSINLLKEIKNYKWLTDKDGNVLDEPVKFMDHALDAARYGTFTKLHKPKKEWVMV